MNEEIKDKNKPPKNEISSLEGDINFYEEYKLELLKDLEDLQKKIKYLEHKKEYLNQDYLKSLDTYNELSNDIQKLTNDINIIDYGIYKPIYNQDDSETYKRELEYVIGLQKEMIKNNTAAICDTTWTINGSKVEGQSFVKNNTQLLLRAFNGDCNAIMAKVRWDNYKLLLERLNRVYKKLNTLGEKSCIKISSRFFELKVKELNLICEYDLKKKAEKEEERTIREERKEEEKALREIERQRKKAEEEELYYQKAIKKVQLEVEKATGIKLEKLTEKIKYLQEQLKEAQLNKERAISMAQQTRRGYVYVISNIGSFGKDIYKIGMTRRLDPIDRIRELSNASVPFPYDVHAMIFSEDAPSLEAKLHNVFNDLKVNKINGRKEFFHVKLSQIEKTISEYGIDFKMVKEPYARDYRESIKCSEKDDSINEYQIKEEPQANSKYPSSLYDNNFFDDSENK